MNTVEKAALLRNRDAIVQNVDFTYIKDQLLTYGVINAEQLEDVDCEVSLVLPNYLKSNIVTKLFMVVLCRKQNLPKCVDCWTCSLK